MPTTNLALCVHFSDAPIAAPRRNIDWKTVEQDYRHAGLSLRDLACKHGCSHSAIANRAVRLGWMRVGAVKPVNTGIGQPRTEPQEQRCL